MTLTAAADALDLYRNWTAQFLTNSAAGTHPTHNSPVSASCQAPIHLVIEGTAL